MPLLIPLLPAAPVVHPEWAIEITSRDGLTGYGLFTYDDLADDSPVLAFDGQDPISDIGAGHLTLPLGHAANDVLAVDRLLHLRVRGHRICSMKINPPSYNVIASSEEAGETVTWNLETLYGILAEGDVQPPGGVDRRPAVQDRPFDSSVARDNSDFEPAFELGDLNDATANYPIIPYAFGMTNRSTVKTISPPGYPYGIAAPNGPQYFYIDHNFSTTGYFIIRGVADDVLNELRIDGQTIQTRSVGFGKAWELPKMLISAGVHRVWAFIENTAFGPCTLSLEVLQVDAADNVINLELWTSNAWSVMAYPPEPPGFTLGEIGLTVIAECQALGLLLDVTPSFTGSHASDGKPWENRWDISTKSGTSVAAFFLKELAETYADFRMRYESGVGVVLDMYHKGDRGYPDSGVVLARGVNIGSLTIEAEQPRATSALIGWNDAGEPAFTRRSVSPEAGHPAKEVLLTLGAQRSAGEMQRVADTQLLKFGRQRRKLTVSHITAPSTPTGQMPGPGYWTADGLTVPTDPDLTPGVEQVIAMTWTLDRTTGLLVFTPELGDDILPSELRPANTFRRLARGAMGGIARNVAPVSV